jgi:hypothetical protein
MPSLAAMSCRGRPLRIRAGLHRNQQLTRREPTMMDLAIITATVARDRVAEQFAGRPATDAAAPGPVRRAAVQALRTVANRLEPTPRYAAQT